MEHVKIEIKIFQRPNRVWYLNKERVVTLVRAELNEVTVRLTGVAVALLTEFLDTGMPWKGCDFFLSEVLLVLLLLLAELGSRLRGALVTDDLLELPPGVLVALFALTMAERGALSADTRALLFTTGSRSRALLTSEGVLWDLPPTETHTVCETRIKHCSATKQSNTSS